MASIKKGRGQSFTEALVCSAAKVEALALVLAFVRWTSLFNKINAHSQTQKFIKFVLPEGTADATDSPDERA